MERVETSLMGHSLVTETGQPFFWLGDTAWELFHRCTLAEAAHYLDNRRERGFNVIQAVILAVLDGIHTPNPNGDLPLRDDDPTRLNEAYFKHVDAIIRMAAERGIYMGILPAWGDKLNPAWGDGNGPALFNPENALAYGELLGKRYRKADNLIWILGGDCTADGYQPIWRAMAQGIAGGLGYQPLMSYHPSGGDSSSFWLHDEDWLGMNMTQSGHILVDAPNWDLISKDYVRQPVKPVLDGEPCYEDHPIDPFLRAWKPEMGRFNDYDVRKAAYRAVFSGACGHTYGHHAVWQFWREGREPINFPTPAWEEALLRPGAAQLVHLKNLMLSRPYLTRIPDQSILVGETVPPPPAAGEHTSEQRARHPRAIRDQKGRWGMVYIPYPSQTVQVDLYRLAGDVNASWYNPRTGQCTSIRPFPNTRVVDFTTPAEGPDWVLVLDEIRQQYPCPGTVRPTPTKPL